MKKEKVRLIRKRIDFSGKTVLDLGSSHGTVSLQLKKLGGEWIHADLDRENLESSRPVLGSKLIRIGTKTLPLRQESVDMVLALDFLEHVREDGAILKEAHRVLRSGGQIVISTPHYGARQLLNRIKPGLGLKPEIYGHVRPGYSLPELTKLLEQNGFRTEHASTYAKFLTEWMELTLNLMYIRKNRNINSNRRTGAISPQSQHEISRHSRLLTFYARVVYPIVYAITRLDHLLFWKKGYATLVIGRKA